MNRPGRILIIICNALVILFMSSGRCQNERHVSLRFEPDVESLRQYECPEWFRDAKFGIYCHWNAQSMYKGEYYGWQARHIYQEERLAYRLHLEQFGHPSRVGYKDVIMAWEADRFDAGEWAALFAEAGARYMVAMAVHHDNFDMWDSRFQPRWNSMNYGPKTDVVGEIRKAALEHGMRFGVTTHLARSYSWVQTNKGADKEGEFAGVPYDGNDPEYRDLYIEYSEDRNTASPLDPPEWWREHWKDRMCDLIDNYHPDHLYFDGGVPFLGEDSIRTGLEVIAHYYNDNLTKYEGKNEAAMFIKNVRNHGVFVEGLSLVDYEGHPPGEILEEPWQTDMGISYWPHNKRNCSWFYNDLAGYYSVNEILEKLADIVSKNGNLLLNIPPRADGTFDQPTLDILKGIGQWMDVNGEAIYGTRPWKVYGEQNVRYTVKGDTLYAILYTGEQCEFQLAELAGITKENIKSVQVLSDPEASIEFTGEGVHVRLLEDCNNLPMVVKILIKKWP